MQSVTIRIYYGFLIILFATSALVLSGLGYLWFGDSNRENLPHLEWLLGTVIVEIAGIVLLIAKRGMKFQPEILTHSNESETMDFMCNLLSQASSATIVSNRASYFNRVNELQNKVKKLSKQGMKLEIITPQPVLPDLVDELSKAGVVFIATGDPTPPEARFTLINAERNGAEKLAISRGNYPHHEVTVFDCISGPQMIAMAKDIVRKSHISCIKKSM